MMISFCPQCGSKVREGAKFCGECGSRLPEEDNVSELKGDESAEVSQMVSSEPPAPESVAPKAKEASRPWHQKLGKKLTDPVKIGIAFMPLYAAIIVAVVTTVGVAFAAVMLYQNVIEPAIVQLQQSASDQAEEAVEKEGTDEQATDEQEENSSDEKPATYTAEGNPQSVLQLAEILAMDPTQIPDYLEGQGLTYYSIAQLEDTGRYTRWADSDGGGTIARTLSELGVGVGLDSGVSSFNSIILGKDVAPDDIFSMWVSDLDNAALKSGNRPRSICLNMKTTEEFDDETATRLIDACGFISNPSHWEFGYDDSSSGELSVTSAASSWTGLVTVSNETCIWFVRQMSGHLQIGCISIDGATTVLREANETYNLNSGQNEQNTYWLPSSAELANTTDEEKALMFAQYLVQRGIDQQSFMGIDVVTGKSASQ